MWSPVKDSFRGLCWLLNNKRTNWLKKLFFFQINCEVFGPWIMYYSRTLITRTRITRIPFQLEPEFDKFPFSWSNFHWNLPWSTQIPRWLEMFFVSLQSSSYRGSTVNNFNPKYFKWKWALTKGIKCTGIYARSAPIILVGRFSDLESSSGPAWRDVYWNMTLKIIARWHKKIWHNNITIHRSRGSCDERSHTVCN